LAVDDEPGVISCIYLHVEGSHPNPLRLGSPLPHQKRTDRKAAIDAVKESKDILCSPP